MTDLRTNIITNLNSDDSSKEVEQDNSNFVVNFGCRLNIAESNSMLEKLNQSQLSNIAIINGCCVTHRSEQKVKQKIRSLRKANPQLKIVLTGCPATINKDFYDAMPELDMVYTNSEKENIIENLELKYQSQTSKVDYDINRIPLSKLTSRAFLPIQNGCDHDCTFCLIPQGRGVSRSLPLSLTLEQIDDLLTKGNEEIVLTGVDLTSWGNDFSQKLFLGDLIETILNNFKFDKRLKRLRISSLDCIELDDKLFTLWSRFDKLMPHVHLSLQSGADLILKRMKRRHLSLDAKKVISRLRSVRPDIVFGADIIAGFPTESDDHFSQTLDFLKQTNITFLHVFAYSKRKNTKAALMPQVDSKTIHTRANILRRFAKQQELDFLNSKVGEKVEVLLEDNYNGYTQDYAKAKISEQETLQHKSFFFNNQSKLITSKVIGVDGQKGYLIIDPETYPENQTV